MRDRFFAKTSTWQRTTLKRDRHPCPQVGFEPAIPASDRPQTLVVDRSATEYTRYVIFGNTDWILGFCLSFIDYIFWSCSELLPVIHVPALTPHVVKHKSGYGPDVPGFYSRPTLFGAHPVSYSVGTGVIFAGVNGRGEKLTAHLHLLLWLRMSGAIPLLLPYRFLQCPKRSYEQCAFTQMWCAYTHDDWEQCKKLWNSSKAENAFSPQRTYRYIFTDTDNVCSELLFALKIVTYQQSVCCVSLCVVLMGQRLIMAVGRVQEEHNRVAWS